MLKQRLDALLVERSLASSRQQAQRLIQAGSVRVNGMVVDKVGHSIDVAATIVVAEKPRYVSRGGDKLAKALQTFSITVTDRICLDGGISTGGFTDCLLQHGAKQVYGIDVGYGQVDWKLRSDPRVVLRERVNLRYLTPGDLYDETSGKSLYPTLGVVDVSFISLTKVLPALWNLLAPPQELIALVKPQFEVGRDRVGKKGVVRDSQDQAQAIEGVIDTGENLGWQVKGLTWSPLTGPAGNIEYLLWLIRPESEPSPWERSQILTIAEEAKTHFASKSSKQELE